LGQGAGLEISDHGVHYRKLCLHVKLFLM
jgi:hypothetical protein